MANALIATHSSLPSCKWIELADLQIIHTDFSMKKCITIFALEIVLVVATSIVTLLATGYFEEKPEIAKPHNEVLPSAKTILPIEKDEVASVASAETDDKLLEENEKLKEQVKALELALTQAKQRTEETEAELEDSESALTKLGDEFLLSYGTIEELGTDMGSLAREAIQIRKQFKELKESGKNWKEMSEEEQKAMRKSMGEVFSKMMNFAPVVQEIKTLDENPDEAARLQASFIGEVFNLDESKRQQVEYIYENAYLGAQQHGLASNQKPDVETESWEKRRTEYGEKIHYSLSEVLDDEQLETIKWMGKGSVLNMPDLSMQNLRR